MMNEYESIIWPAGTTKQQKKWFLSHLRQKAKERERLCVIYHPDCGCSIEYFVVLDRFPMSEKIHCLCDECKKGCLLEISDPIIFHLPLTNQDYTLEEIKKMHVSLSFQKHLIEKWRDPSMKNER